MKYDYSLVPPSRKSLMAARLSIILSIRICFRVYILTVWGNAVLDPERSGIAVEDLSVLHDYLNEELAAVLGKDATLTSCYEYIMSKPGEDSLIRLQIAAEHKAFLHHFAALILSQA